MLLNDTDKNYHDMASLAISSLPPTLYRCHSAVNFIMHCHQKPLQSLNNNCLDFSVAQTTMHYCRIYIPYLCSLLHKKQHFLIGYMHVNTQNDKWYGQGSETILFTYK